MACEKQFTTKNGLSVREREAVPAAGTIVFLHGSGFCKDIFDIQFESVSLHNYRLIGIDLPGHGASIDANDPLATYNFAGFAREVEQALVELKVEKCVIFGWSLGGHVALELGKTCAFVRGVMTMGTPPVSSGPLGLVRSMHFSKALLLAGKAKMSRADAELFECYCLGDQSDGRFVQSLMRTDPLMRPALSKATLHDFGPGQLGDVKRANFDICLIHGAQDPFIRTSYMQSIEAPALYRGGAIVYENSGHAPFLAEPERFEMQLLDFHNYVQVSAPRIIETSLAA
ncbi:MAG: alpha/beta hydrolase [Rhizobiaceae bacterium]